LPTIRWTPHRRSSSFEQFAGYVDDSLGAPERETVERHLAACEECESDLQGFLDLSTLIGGRDKVPIVATVPSPNASPAFWERLRASWQAPLSGLSYRPLFQAAALLAVAVIVIWAISRSNQARIDGLTAQVGQLKAENDSMREAASSADAQIARLQKENEEVRLAGDQSQIAVRLNDGIGQWLWMRLESFKDWKEFRLNLDRPFKLR
jgi:hypothetical protein